MANRIMLQRMQERNSIQQATPSINATPPATDAGLNAAHAAAVRETEMHKISVETVKDYKVDGI